MQRRRRKLLSLPRQQPTARLAKRKYKTSRSNSWWRGVYSSSKYSSSSTSAPSLLLASRGVLDALLLHVLLDLGLSSLFLSLLSSFLSLNNRHPRGYAKRSGRRKHAPRDGNTKKSRARMSSPPEKETRKNDHTTTCGGTCN